MRYVRFAAGFLAVSLATVFIAGIGSVPGHAQSLAPAYPNTPDTARANGGYQVIEGPKGAYIVSRGDGELHKLMESEASSEREVRRLVDEYARTDNEGQRSKIKSKLSEVLDKQFDLQQKRREMEVAQIEAQLKKLRELMRKRSEARQTIVDRRLDQLVRDAEGLGWSSPAGGGNSYINRAPGFNFTPPTITGPQTR
jgi:hypothetical protein